MTSNVIRLFGNLVHGVQIDERSGCAHYRSSLDIVAIRHHCCGKWFACFECHTALVKHRASVWPCDQFDVLAILCGMCGTKVSIATYLSDPTSCSACSARFNPGCVLHHHLYFEQ